MSTYLLIAAGIGLGLLIALRGIWNLARPDPSDDDGESADRSASAPSESGDAHTKRR